MAHSTRCTLFFSALTATSLFISSGTSHSAPQPNTNPNVIKSSDLIGSEMSAIFFSSDGNSLNRQNIEFYKEFIRETQSDIRKRVTRKKQFLDGKPEEKAKKDAETSTIVLGYDLLLNMVDDLLQMKALSQQKEQVNRIIEHHTSLRANIGNKVSLLPLFGNIGAFVERIAISKSGGVEAINLTTMRNGVEVTLSESEIATLKKSINPAADLSLYNPPQDNSVIDINKNIEQTNVVQDYFSSQGLYKGASLVFPETQEDGTTVVEFDEVPKSETNPKVKVKYTAANGRKMKFRIKMGNEMHSEPTAAALANALGLYTDKMKYYKNVKVVFNKGQTCNDFWIPFKEYYTYAKTPIMWTDLKRYIKEQKCEGDQQYIVFHEAVLEKRFDTDEVLRLGEWKWTATDIAKRREFRAIHLFNYWIHNTDALEGRQNRIIYNALDKKSYYLEQDLGYSFAYFLYGRPLNYSWNLAERSGDRVVFNFHYFHPRNEHDQVTWSDARWMVRRIARLSRDQISQAVSLGHWPNQHPYNYHQLIVEKLIERRNQLVQSFDLVGQPTYSGSSDRITLMAVQREVEKQAIAATDNNDGSTADLSPEITGMILPGIGRTLKDISGDLVTGTLSSVKSIDLIPQNIGINNAIIADLLLRYSRERFRNPNAKDHNEMYLMKDQYQIGGRLGFGTFLSGDVAKATSYTALYAVGSVDEARTQQRLAFHANDPYHLVEFYLPTRHIYVSDRMIEGRLQARSLPNSPVGVEASVFASKGHVKRTMVVRLSELDAVVCREQFPYWEIGGRIVTKVALANFEHFKARFKKMMSTKNCYAIKLEDENQYEAVTQALRSNFKLLQSLGNPDEETLKAVIETSSWELNLFGFVKAGMTEKNSHTKEITTDENGQELEVLRETVSSDKTRTSSWTFLANKESNLKQVQSGATVNSLGKLENPMIQIRFVQEDRNAMIEEFEQGYFSFIDGLAGQRNFLSYNVRNESNLESLGFNDFHITLQYKTAAIEKLLLLGMAKKSKDAQELAQSTDPANAALLSFYRILAANLGIADSNPQTIAKFLGTPARERSMFDDPRRPVRREWRDVNRTYFGNRYNLALVLGQVESFLNELERVERNKTTPKDQMKHLARAFDKIVPRKGHSYSPIILNAVSQFVGWNNCFLSVLMDVPANKQNSHPTGEPTINIIGSMASAETTQVLNGGYVDAEDPLALWQLYFD